MFLSFLAGVLSFLSPCVLPLYPSYISYISGVTFSPSQTHTLNHRIKAVTHTLFFILGFSIIFFALGLSATLIGQVFISYRSVIRIVGGIIVIVMGLALSGLLTPKWLMMEKKWEYKGKKPGYFGSVLVGISFAAGWSPCIGPILGAVLVLSASQSAYGISLILAYIVGFAIPYLILGFSLGSVRKLAKYGAILSKIGGYIMIVMGILLLTNMLTLITIWLIKLYGGFTGF
ncbi:cytochrome c biogenesis CcdA family protein [Ferroacidibacillus organovorans]|uniref:cytochrome c biogenesis CcdA family protein n=1 Tax=Ferroacidibacillus organovorans TaxID=1765683 RepID=UPI000AC85030|nr:cytochrome c biogenesis protein CcdA [Ferroacidibacillus organovorans]